MTLYNQSLFYSIALTSKNPIYEPGENIKFFPGSIKYNLENDRSSNGPFQGSIVTINKPQLMNYFPSSYSDFSKPSTSSGDANNFDDQLHLISCLIPGSSILA